MSILQELGVSSKVDRAQAGAVESEAVVPVRATRSFIGAVSVVGLTLAMAGCDRAAPSVGMVRVVNESRAEASIHWQSPGLLGTQVFGGSGTEPILPCASYTRGFADGDQSIVITTKVASRSFVLEARSTRPTTRSLVIRPDGAIEETTETDLPASPYCD